MRTTPIVWDTPKLSPQEYFELFVEEFASEPDDVTTLKYIRWHFRDLVHCENYNGGIVPDSRDDGQTFVKKAFRWHAFRYAEEVQPFSEKMAEFWKRNGQYPTKDINDVYKKLPWNLRGNDTKYTVAEGFYAHIYTNSRNPTLSHMWEPTNVQQLKKIYRYNDADYFLGNAEEFEAGKK